MHLTIQAVVEFGLQDKLNYEELTPGPFETKNNFTPFKWHYAFQVPLRVTVSLCYVTVPCVTVSLCYVTVSLRLSSFSYGPRKRKSKRVSTENFDSVKSGGFWWISGFWVIKRTMRCEARTRPFRAEAEAHTAERGGA